MIRNIKALGLAVVAVAAMSMVAASAAQATQLHAATGKSATITGEQILVGGQHVFKLTTSGAETKCQKAHFEGTFEDPLGQATQATTDELTLTPTYQQCTTAGLASQVLMNGCKYTITGTHINGQVVQTLSKTAWVDITGCTAGKAIQIKLFGCEITVPEQTTLSHITFANVGTEVEANVTVQGITYEFHGASCPVHPITKVPAAVTTLTHDGDYTGKALFKAFVDLGTQQVTEHTHQFNKNNKIGAQVALTVT